MAGSRKFSSPKELSPFQVFQGTVTLLGVIVEWVDDKGYGWIKSGERRYFIHITDFERGQRRPKLGEEVRFIQGIDSRGRGWAKCVTFVRTAGRMGVGGSLLLLVSLALPSLALLSLPFAWWQGAGALMLVSAITYSMYAHDKHRAETAGWRVPERSLHLAELLGGWPGGLLAQRLLRHKCSKTSYQITFWSIVILYQIAAVDVILEQRLSRALLDFIMR